MSVLDYRWLRLEMECYFQTLSQSNKIKVSMCKVHIFTPHCNLYEDDNHRIQ